MEPQHFGFRSQGHFAKANQQLFAESPSTTLSQALSQRALRQKRT